MDKQCDAEAPERERHRQGRCSCIFSYGDREIAPTIWGDLSLVELLCARRVARSWRDGIATMPQWTPIVPAPGAEHASPVQVFVNWGRWYSARDKQEQRIAELDDQLYHDVADSTRVRDALAMQREQEQLEAQLGAQCTAYDAWASLAPFTRIAAGEDVAWIRGAVGLSGQAAAGSVRRSARVGTSIASFFQTRERSYESFREFRSKDVARFLYDVLEEDETGGLGWDDPVFNKAAAQRPIEERRVRLVVAHTSETLRQHAPTVEHKITLALRVLRCYLQPAGAFEVQRDADVYLPQIDGLTRECVQGTGTVQLDAGAALRRHKNDPTIRRQVKETTPTYIVAPHLFSHTENDLAWFFSSPLRERGWVISTYQFDRNDIGYGPPQRLRGFVQTVVYSALHATGLSLCENTPCVMNNCDGVEEMIRTPMLLCPGCLRKLQLIGAMPDVSQGLRDLREIVASERGWSFRSAMEDVVTLERWGFGA